MQRQRVRLQRRRLRAPVEPMQRETRLQRRLGRDRLRSRYGRQKALPQRISGHRKRKRRHEGKKGKKGMKWNPTPQQLKKVDPTLLEFLHGYPPRIEKNIRFLTRGVYEGQHTIR